MERAIPMGDRISTLPDAVLCHILSFLPTKVAGGTMVLSKRWMALWLSVPALHFDDGYVDDEESFIRFNQFVYAVMLSRDVKQPIKRFCLRGYYPLWDEGPYPVSNVNVWVNAAIQRRVEHLHLELSALVDLPSGILRCRTLVVLKLRGLNVKTLSSVDLPSLKIVHLEFVHFSERRYLLDLLSVCPILEDLQIKRLPDIHYFAGDDCSKSLPMLVRADISNYDMPLKAIYNVEFLRMEDVQLCYNDIHTFRNLTHMELIFEYFSWHWLVEVLKHCPKLQFLVVDKMELNEIYDQNWTNPQFVPECLSLHLRTCTLKHYVDREGEHLFARYIMQNGRVLQTMTICSTLSLDSDEQLEILKKLSLCPRSSATCQLLFE